MTEISKENQVDIPDMNKDGIVDVLDMVQYAKTQEGAQAMQEAMQRQKEERQREAYIERIKKYYEGKATKEEVINPSRNVTHTEETHTTSRSPVTLSEIENFSNQEYQRQLSEYREAARANPNDYPSASEELLRMSKIYGIIHSPAYKDKSIYSKTAYPEQWSKYEYYKKGILSKEVRNILGIPEEAPAESTPTVTPTVLNIDDIITDLETSDEEYYNIPGVGYVEKETFLTNVESWKDAGYSQISVGANGVIQPAVPSSDFVKPGEAEDTYTMGVGEAFKFITSQKDSEGNDLFRSNEILNNLQLEISDAYSKGYKYVTINPVTGHVIGKYKEQPTLEDIQSAVYASGGDLLDAIRAENTAQEGGFLSKGQTATFQKVLEYNPESPAEGVESIADVISSQDRINQDINNMIEGIRGLPSVIRYDKSTDEIGMMSGEYKGTEIYTQEGLSDYFNKLSTSGNQSLNFLQNWKNEGYAQVELTEGGIRPYVPSVGYTFEEFQRDYLTDEQRSSLPVAVQESMYRKVLTKGTTSISEVLSDIAGLPGNFVNIAGLGVYKREDILPALEEWKQEGYQRFSIEDKSIVPYIPAVNTLNPQKIFERMEQTPEPALNIQGFGEISDMGVAYTDEEGNPVTWSDYFKDLANKGIQSMNVSGEGENKALEPVYSEVPVGSVDEMLRNIANIPAQVVSIPGVGVFDRASFEEQLGEWDRLGIEKLNVEEVEGEKSLVPYIPSISTSSVDEAIRRMKETPESAISFGSSLVASELDMLPVFEGWREEGITEFTVDEKGNIKPVINPVKITSLPKPPSLKEQENISDYLSQWQTYRSNLKSIDRKVDASTPFVSINGKLYKGSDIQNWIDNSINSANNMIESVSSQKDYYHAVEPTSSGSIQFVAPKVNMKLAMAAPSIKTGKTTGILPSYLTFTPIVMQKATGVSKEVIRMIPTNFFGSISQKVFQQYEEFKGLQEAFSNPINMRETFTEVAKVMTVPTYKYIPPEELFGYTTTKLKEVVPSSMEFIKGGFKVLTHPFEAASIVAGMHKYEREETQEGGIPYDFYIEHAKELGMDTSKIEQTRTNLPILFAESLSNEPLSPFVAQQFKKENPPFKEESLENVYVNPETMEVEFKPEIDWDKIYKSRGDVLWEQYKEEPAKGLAHYVGLGLVSSSDQFHTKTIFHDIHMEGVGDLAAMFLGGAIIGSYESIKYGGIPRMPKVSTDAEDIRFRAGKAQLEEESMRYQPLTNQAIHILSTPLAIAGYSAAISVGAPALAGVGASAGSGGAGTAASFAYAYPLTSAAIKGGVIAAGGIMMGTYVADPLIKKDWAEAGARLGEMGIYTLVGMGAYDLYYGKPYFVPKIKRGISAAGDKIKLKLSPKEAGWVKAYYDNPSVYGEARISELQRLGYTNAVDDTYIGSDLTSIDRYTGRTMQDLWNKGIIEEAPGTWRGYRVKDTFLTNVENFYAESRNPEIYKFMKYLQQKNWRETSNIFMPYREGERIGTLWTYSKSSGYFEGGIKPNQKYNAPITDNRGGIRISLDKVNFESVYNPPYRVKTIDTWEGLSKGDIYFRKMVGLEKYRYQHVPTSELDYSELAKAYNIYTSFEKGKPLLTKSDYFPVQTEKTFVHDIYSNIPKTKPPKRYNVVESQTDEWMTKYTYGEGVKLGVEPGSPEYTRLIQEDVLYNIEGAVDKFNLKRIFSWKKSTGYDFLGERVVLPRTEVVPIKNVRFVIVTISSKEYVYYNR